MNQKKTFTGPALNTPMTQIIGMLLRYWYWFIVSVGICFSAGFFYTKSLSYKYSANAVILVQTPGSSQGSSTSEQIGNMMLAELGVNGGPAPVENEIVIIRSSQLIRKVVEKLDLTTSYSVKPVLRQTDIYGANPVEVKWIVKPATERLSFYIRIVSSSEYLLSLEKNFNEAKKFKFDDEVELSGSKFKVKTTTSFGNGFNENDIRVDLTNAYDEVLSITSRLAVYRTDKVTGTVVLKMQDGNLEKAKSILNTIIEVYNIETINNKNKAAQSTATFIADRIAMIYNDLDDVDTELTAFRIENNLVDITNVTTSVFESRKECVDAISELDMQIKLAQGVSVNIGVNDKGEYNLIAPNPIYNELGVAAQITQYNDFVVRLQEMKRNSGANNPVFIRAKEQIAILNSNTQVAIRNIVDNLYAQKTIVEEQLKIIDEQINTIPKKERVVKDVVRERSIKEQLYLFLLNKRETNALQMAITEPNATLVEPARGSPEPIYPDIPMILIASVIFGFLIPGVIIFLLRILDNKIYSKRDIEEATTIPILGVLPDKTKSQEGVDVVVSETARDPLTEGFRVVRSNIDFFVPNPTEGNGRVIQLTSTLSGDGKTFCSLNMALSIANTNKKVVLLDLDLRRGGLSKVLNKNRKKSVGVTTFLSGKCNDFEDIITKSVYSDALDVVTIGAIPPNAVSLLMSDRFKELIAELRTRYDYIVMDSAPYYLVADSQIINSISDLTIWVIRSGRIDKGILPELDYEYKDHKISNLSILLTGTNISISRYGNYGYSSYGYGYGYDNGEKS
ncbi:MAG: polysaccharide biosynthesis tyrosine autokinase [Rikenellaceae bacterium]